MAYAFPERTVAGLVVVLCICNKGGRGKERTGLALGAPFVLKIFALPCQSFCERASHEVDAVVEVRIVPKVLPCNSVVQTMVDNAVSRVGVSDSSLGGRCVSAQRREPAAPTARNEVPTNSALHQARPSSCRQKLKEPRDQHHTYDKRS